MNYTIREIPDTIHYTTKTQISISKGEKMIRTLRSTKRKRMRAKEERFRGEQDTQIRSRQAIKWLAHSTVISTKARDIDTDNLIF